MQGQDSQDSMSIFQSEAWPGFERPTLQQVSLEIARGLKSLVWVLGRTAQSGGYSQLKYDSVVVSLTTIALSSIRGLAYVALSAT